MNSKHVTGLQLWTNWSRVADLEHMILQLAFCFSYRSGPLSNFPQLHIQVSDYRSNYLVIQFSGKHPIPAILSLQESSMILSEYSVGNISFSCSDILRHGNNWMPDILYYVYNTSIPKMSTIFLVDLFWRE